MRQCKFSRMERSLKIVANEDFEADRNAFVTPGCAVSWPIAAIHNARDSTGPMYPGGNIGGKGLRWGG